jgi:mono/diheme cytochrome c family protein
VRRAVPDAYYTFMGKAIRVTSSEFQPKLGQTVPAHAPPEAPTRERGEYVARYVANCRGCHTKADESTMTWTGPEFAGGLEFDTAPEWPGGDPKQWFRSPNLTPIPNGVLKTLGTKENWIARFRAGRAYKASPMQWGPFSRMSDADLEALWIFFNSLPPVPNDLGPTTFYKEEEKK